MSKGSLNCRSTKGMERKDYSDDHIEDLEQEEKTLASTYSFDVISWLPLRVKELGAVIQQTDSTIRIFKRYKVLFHFITDDC